MARKYTVQQRLHLDGQGQAVPAGHPDAGSLFSTPGKQIPWDLAVQVGLVDVDEATAAVQEAGHQSVEAQQEALQAAAQAAAEKRRQPPGDTKERKDPASDKGQPSSPPVTGDLSLAQLVEAGVVQQNGSFYTLPDGSQVQGKKKAAAALNVEVE